MLLYHNHMNKRNIFKYAQFKRTNINLKILPSLEQKKNRAWGNYRRLDENSGSKVTVTLQNSAMWHLFL